MAGYAATIAVLPSTTLISNDFALYGSRSLGMDTGTGNANGADYRVPLAPSTQYSLSLWARLEASSAAAFNIGRSETTYTTGTASQTPLPPQ